MKIKILKMSELNEEIKRLQELLINIKEERAKHKHDFLDVLDELLSNFSKEQQQVIDNKRK